MVAPRAIDVQTIYNINQLAGHDPALGPDLNLGALVLHLQGFASAMCFSNSGSGMEAIFCQR